MFIELTEYLRCPSGHGDEYLVLTPDTMQDRDVVAGTLGCPVCKREFQIVDGVARLGEASPALNLCDANPDAVHALLDLTSSGGYVVCVGSAASLAHELFGRLDDVHVVVVNAGADFAMAGKVSVVWGDDQIPLRSGIARAVVMGKECSAAMVSDGVRVLLTGRRYVVTEERAVIEAGIEVLATGDGLSVGEKRQASFGSA